MINTTVRLLGAISGAVLWAGIASFGAAGSVPPAAAGPRIVFQAAVWDFGTVKRTESPSHEFVFRNEGDAPLHIHRIHSECGCTTATPAKKEIAPGSSGRLAVTFRAADFAGEILRRLFVYSDDPERPELLLEIKGVIRGPKIVFETDVLNFGRFKSTDQRTGEFVFHNLGNEPLNVKNVETSCGCTAALVTERTIAPEKSGKIKVTFNGRGYAGPVEKMVILETDDPIAPRVELKTIATVDAPAAPVMELEPADFDHGLLIEGESTTSEVIVRNGGELDLSFRIQVPFVEYFVDGKPAEFPLEINVPAAGLVKVAIRSSTEGRHGVITDRYLISTNDPAKNTFILTVTGYVATKAQLLRLFEKYGPILK